MEVKFFIETNDPNHPIIEIKRFYNKGGWVDVTMHNYDTFYPKALAKDQKIFCVQSWDSRNTIRLERIPRTSATEFDNRYDILKCWYEEWE